MVLIEAASEPLAGSVRQKAAIVSPGRRTQSMVCQTHTHTQKDLAALRPCLFSSSHRIYILRSRFYILSYDLHEKMDPNKSSEAGLLTCGEFRQVLLLLCFVSKK